MTESDRARRDNILGFRATDLPHVPPENPVQIGIGSRQAPRPGTRVGRERGTAIMTVTDTAFVPGSGRPVPGGFLPREMPTFIQLISERPLADIEVVECLPPHDDAETPSPIATRVSCDTFGCLVRAGHLPHKTR